MKKIIFTIIIQFILFFFFSIKLIGTDQFYEKLKQEDIERSKKYERLKSKSSVSVSSEKFSFIQALPVDSDDDGMPNSFENANGLNPNDPDDAWLDPDNDKVVNLFEYQLGSGINDPTTPKVATVGLTGADYTDVETAIDSVADGTVIRVANGTYNVNYSTFDPPVVVMIQGGWNSIFNIRNLKFYPVTFDGRMMDEILYFSMDSGDPVIILDGINFINGKGSFGAVNLLAKGTASMKTSIFNCSIMNSESTFDFVGVLDFGGVLNLYNWNESQSDRTIANSLIANNNSSGIYNQITENTAARWRIINTTISNNKNGGGNNGYGIDAFTLENGELSAHIYNSIIWGNEQSDIDISRNINFNVDHSDIDTVTTYGAAVYNSGIGMVNTDPLFVNVTGNDFHLQGSSTLINSGTDEGIPLIDFEGNSRIYDNVPDLGPFEYQPTVGIPFISLNRTKLNFGGVKGGNSSHSQSFLISNSGGGTLNWSITDNASWLSCSPSSGINSGEIGVSVDPTGLSAGTYTGTITVSDPNATNSPQTVSVMLKVYSPGGSSVPFGDFATPIHGSTVSSSIAVTGWVLDDIGVESLKIYSGQIYIGDAVFVEGVRPDIETAFPDYPLNYQAGWGYMLLTNFLPGGGNGVYTLNAIASDVEGNQATLGSKTITVDNANAVKPFGAIDTPTQGGTASGSSFKNRGWVLTPLPNKVPEDGSTIKLYINSVLLNNAAVYNLYRADIAGYFPGYANSNGAAAEFTIDTTAYSNGVHQIFWIAVDNAGNTDGIGSRFFSIQNLGSSSSGNSAAGFTQETPIVRFEDLKSLPIEYNVPVRIKKGFREDAESKEMYFDNRGIVIVEIKELERVIIQLTHNHKRSDITGYMLGSHRLRPLPIGSTLDTKTGTFYWLPGPGFIGEYGFVFVEKKPDGEMNRKTILVKISPKFAVEVEEAKK